jgi:glucosamine--fructose-6-phosphate aminotransferase (isomerizing)
MLKEIHEQPQTILDTMRGRYSYDTGEADLPDIGLTAKEFAAVGRIWIVACGTSWHSGLVGKYLLEEMVRTPVQVDIGSEFRYRDPLVGKDDLFITISQSGETADTLAALRHCKAEGQHIAAIVNVPESTIAREAGALLPTHAGPEIGVASTKAFTCQLSVLACLAIALGRARGTLDAAEERRLVRLLTGVPRLMAEALKAAPGIETLAQQLVHARDVLYLGRGLSYPLALEGALKLKEISYIHAEGYAAGELKHGPIALIDEAVPVIVIAPPDELFEKTLSNMHEVMARGGRVLLLSDEAGITKAGEGLWASIPVPTVDPFIVPLIYAVPIQLLAYHTAVAKGTDVDQPRNLAKSVTVE